MRFHYTSNLSGHLFYMLEMLSFEYLFWQPTTSPFLGEGCSEVELVEASFEGASRRGMVVDAGIYSGGFHEGSFGSFDFGRQGAEEGFRDWSDCFAAWRN
jgi:hypothetical protein